ncbi:MAG: hypothetical protein U1E29_10830, partial [Coriobacteriia bacterium]|nr:hypothetical protein [Coriobacteriia bacterium]
ATAACSFLSSVCDQYDSNQQTLDVKQFQQEVQGFIKEGLLQVNLGAALSGNKVVSSGEFKDLLRKAVHANLSMDRKAFQAIEMEAAGIGKVIGSHNRSERMQRVRFGMIRGISDDAENKQDSDKDVSRELWRDIAVRAAVRYALGFLGDRPYGVSVGHDGGESST